MRTLRVLALTCAVAASMAYGGDTKPEPVPPTSVPAPAPLLQMSSPRAVHAAVTLADGRVALIGGCVADGCETGPGSGTVEIYNPKTHRMSPGGALTAARVGAAAVALGDGRVLIAGGWSGRQTTASVELYDPSARTSVEIGALRSARGDIAAVTLADGRVALIGGMGDTRVSGDVDIFDPRTQRLKAGPPLAHPRAAAATVRLRDGRVLVVGGGAGAGRPAPSAVAEIADASLTKWAAAGSLNQARYKHAAVALADGRALVVGGSDERDRQGKIPAFEIFDPKSLSFATAGRSVVPRFKIGGAVVALDDGRVFIAGGEARAEIYDPATMVSVLAGPPLDGVRSFATASLLPDGRVVIAGGYEENSIAVSRGLWVVKP